MANVGLEMVRVGVTSLAACAVWMTATAASVLDPTGYVTLAATDDAGTTSFASAQNWTSGAAPTSGQNYLVQGDLLLRTPDSSGVDYAFAGDSLTLDNGNMNLKHLSGTATIADFRLYECQIAQGHGGDNGSYSWIALDGNIHVFATAAAPARLTGSQYRTMEIKSTIDGARGTVIEVTNTRKPRVENSSIWGRFNAVFSGTNPNYLGTFRATSPGNCIVAGTLGNLGPGDPDAGTPIVTLKDKAGLYGNAGLAWDNPNYTIKVENSCLVGSYKSADKLPNGATVAGLLFDGGMRFVGNGSIYVINRDGGTAFNRVRFDSGITNIVAAAGGTRFYEDYTNNTMPVVVQANSTIAGWCDNVGPVTVEGDGQVSPGVGVKSLGTLGLASLTMKGTDSYLIMSMLTNGQGEVEADFVDVKGNLTLAGGKTVLPIEVDAVQTDVVDYKVKLLTAANLTDFTPASFSIRSADPAMNDWLEGTFSIEEENGKHFLYFTRTSRPIVRLTGNDWYVGSFNAAGFWDNNQAPSSAYDYQVEGKLLRARKAGTFQGHSLSILKDGDFAINGVEATVNDLRMYDQSAISVRNNGAGNVLNGVVEVRNGTAAFRIEQPEGAARQLTLNAALKGESSVAVQFANYPWVTTGGSYLLRGDNSGFAGQVQICGKNVIVDITDAQQLGCQRDKFYPDALLIGSNGCLRCSQTMTLNDATRGITLTRYVDTNDRSFGGMFNVAAGQTLTISVPITGFGAFWKTGLGELVLAGSNTWTLVTLAEEGKLTVSNKFALSGMEYFGARTGAVVRVATESGVLLTSVRNAEFISRGAYGDIHDALPVEVAAFDSMPKSGASVRANLFIFAPGYTGYEGKIRITNPPEGHKVELFTETTADGVLLYAVARKTGTVLLFR